MENKNKIIALCIIILILIGIGFIWIDSNYNADIIKEPGFVEMGVLVPLTGFGDLGPKMQRGAELATEEINEAGGINGKKIKLVYEDDQCKPETGVTAIKKLVEVDNIHIIVGPLCSSVSLSVSPYAEQTQTLIMNGGLAPKLRTAGDYIFRPIPGAEIIAGQHADFTFEELNKRKTAFLFANNDFGIGYTGAFKEQYEKIGGQISASEKYSAGDSDFKTQLIKIKETNPEAILIVGSPKEMGLASKQIMELGIKCQILLPPSAESPDLISAGGQTVEGAIYSYGYSDKASSKVKAKFIKEYTKRYGEDTSWHAAVGYDAVMIYAKALEECNANTEETSCIKKAIYSLNYNGAQGKIEFDSYGDALLPITFKTIIGGKFVNYQ
jgi:branched-chain amino acid transport system substrate-binding protein